MLKKNFLIISSDISPGGISEMLVIYTVALLNLNYKVTLVLPNNSVTIFRIKTAVNSIKIDKDALKVIQYKKHQLYYARFVFSSFFKNIFSNIHGCFIHNARLIPTVRKYTNKTIFAVNHTGKKSQYKYYKKSNLILSVNKTINNQLIKSGIDKSKCLVCVNSLLSLPDIDAINELKDKEEIKIGVIGRFVKKKGFEDFIEAIKILKNRKHKIIAFMAGDGVLSKTLQEKAKPHPEIKFLGWVKNKEEFYRKIDIFCQPSYFEPFGLTVIEAMSYSLPVISTNCDGPREIIGNEGKNGFLVPIGDSQKMANYIEKLINDKSKRIETGICARKHIEKHYTLNSLQNLLSRYIDENT